MDLKYAKIIIRESSLPEKFNISKKVNDCVTAVIPDIPTYELELKVNAIYYTRSFI